MRTGQSAQKRDSFPGRTVLQGGGVSMYLYAICAHGFSFLLKYWMIARSPD